MLTHNITFFFGVYKENINILNEHGETCLMKYFSFVRNWSPDTTNRLLEAGIDLNKKNCGGYAAIHASLMNRNLRGSTELLEWFEEKGCNWKLKSNRNKTPL